MMGTRKVDVVAVMQVCLRTANFVFFQLDHQFQYILRFDLEMDQHLSLAWIKSYNPTFGGDEESTSQDIFSGFDRHCRYFRLARGANTAGKPVLVRELGSIRGHLPQDVVRYDTLWL